MRRFVVKHRQGLLPEIVGRDRSFRGGPGRFEGRLEDLRDQIVDRAKAADFHLHAVSIDSWRHPGRNFFQQVQAVFCACFLLGRHVGTDLARRAGTTALPIAWIPVTMPPSLAAAASSLPSSISDNEISACVFRPARPFPCLRQILERRLHEHRQRRR